MLKKIEFFLPFLVKFTSINQIPQPRNSRLVQGSLHLEADTQSLTKIVSDTEASLVRNCLIVKFVDDFLMSQVFSGLSSHRKREDGSEVCRDVPGRIDGHVYQSSKPDLCLRTKSIWDIGQRK